MSVYPAGSFRFAEVWYFFHFESGFRLLRALSIPSLSGFLSFDGYKMRQLSRGSRIVIRKGIKNF